MSIELPADLLSSGDVAKLLGVSPTAVHLWVRSGQLRALLRTGSGFRLFTRTAVEQFSEARERNRRLRRTPLSAERDPF